MFIKFIQYLFDKDFNVLPKICLAVDKAKEQIGFKVKSLNIKYNYIMPKIDYKEVNENTYVSYTGIIEYNFKFENKMIPKEFVCYLENVKVTEALQVSQKHGCQMDFENIPFVNVQGEDNPESIINRYSW